MNNQIYYLKKCSTVLFVVIGFSALFFSSALASSITPGSFSTTWKTDNQGPSNDNQITIPTIGGGYNYDVYWEEVSTPGNNGSSTGNTGDVTITFPSAGIYRVDITGNFPRIFLGNFSGTTDREKLLTIEQWGAIVWSSMEQAFARTPNLTIPAIDAPDLSTVTILRYMFYEATMINEPINHWDVSNVTNMSGMFSQTSTFNQSLDSWDVSNVTDISGMFTGATAFNQSLNNWDVSSVTSIVGIFSGAELFNQPLDNWNLSNVTNFSYLFNYALTFNQPLDSWDVFNVTSMNGTFGGAASFNQPLNNWDVSNVTNMNGMFSNATAFNQPLNNWDVSNVEILGISEEGYVGMFSGATSFNQPLNNWDVSRVTGMEDLFKGATTFNQDLSMWNISNVTTMEDMFIDSALSSVNYSTLLTSWSLLPVQADVNFGTNSLYCETAQAARDTLTIDKTWVITDGGVTSECAEEEVLESSSGGSTGTRVGYRMKDRLSTTTTSSTPAEGTESSFLKSVRTLVDQITKNEDKLDELTPEESTKIIVMLREIIIYLLDLIPGV